MGKFLSRFVMGTMLGLAAVWIWNHLNQSDDSFEDDDEVVEIQIGGNKAATDSVIATSAVAVKPEQAATDGKAATPATSSHAKVEGSSSTIQENLEWVNGIGPVFNRMLSEAGIRTNADLASASVEQLRAAGANRDDEELADWIEQAKQRISGK
jgi:predicted flap endonuclease-1-like 5' DNA nuclease